MKGKYPQDSIVYSYYFDWETAELKHDTLIVYNYEYLDGMQWNVVDEYTCYKECEVPHLKFFKKKKQSLVRLPGLLISDDPIVAKIKLLNQCVERFGYVSEQDKPYLEPKLVKIAKKAKSELKTLSEQYPEKFLKAINNIAIDETIPCLWK